MAKQNRPDRWESSLLAAALALAGAPFLFDRLGALIGAGILSPAIQHSAPVLLVAVGAVLLLAGQNTGTADSGRARRKGDQHEL